MRNTTKLQILSCLYLAGLTHAQAYLEWNNANGDKHWALFILQCSCLLTVGGCAMVKEGGLKP